MAIKTVFDEQHKSDLLSSPEGKQRLLKLQIKSLLKLRSEVEHVLQQIRDKESIIVSWLSLTIVLGILQIYPAMDEGIFRLYLVCIFPTLIIALCCAAFTLIGHPTYVLSDFVILEDEAIDEQIASYEAEIDGLKAIYVLLHASYERKKRGSKFVGPAILVNLISNSIFIYVVTFWPQSLSLPNVIKIAIPLGLLSICMVFILEKRLTLSKDLRYSIGPQ